MNVSQLVYMFLVNEGINKNGRREGGRVKEGGREGQVRGRGELLVQYILLEH